MANYTLQINGRTVQADVDADTPLLWVLRDHLGLVRAPRRTVVESDA